MSQSSSNAKPEAGGARAFLSIGSNAGERESAILAAVSALDSHPRIEVDSLSPLFETDPVGDGYTYPFINAVVLIRTGLTPSELLSACHQIESRFGRKPEARGGDRTMDIDIIDFANLVISEDGLVLPHPRAAARLFVLEPFGRIDPGFRLPGCSLTVSAMAAELKAGGGVRMISHRKEIPIELLE
ncbi:MAG TPA: 2-amino-4-hydroxy-6-hydroxymethyldihydropteridine diphosphokinase [Candidatus Krumholzibacterium sp.]|nr:2-amino-4-hydroxy-6-hydroxymethyldihydropteridine diphosphokinase [Candidatus Krumholzibacterium sp.]